MPPRRQTTHLIVSLSEGLALRNSLPLDHVLRVLTELRSMIETTGRRIQRERGIENPTGDFGVELVAGFRRGSVKAMLRFTRDVHNAIDAAEEVVSTVRTLRAEARRRKPPRETPDLDPRVVNKLNNLAKLQEIDHTVLTLTLQARERRMKAVFDDEAIRYAATFRAPTFTMEGLTVFGKLMELKDHSPEEVEDGKNFFGQLLGDDGQRWRIRFKSADTERAAELFRKQVFVTGSAAYYRATSPLIRAEIFGPDETRDYEAAFDELYGSEKEAYKSDLESLIEDLRGDR